METRSIKFDIDKIKPFSRDFFGSDEVLTRIGTGAIGGKASGLAFIKDFLADKFDHRAFNQITINIPRLAVLATDVFDSFMERNGLWETVQSEEPDNRIAHAFQKADFPAEMVGDLRALTGSVHTPLAIRSSSLLEDAMYEPFAGVYATKMIPNNQPDTDTRFVKLMEAIKYVYASTFFKSARDYIRATGKSPRDEKMGVIIQEVVGLKNGEFFYPTFSGVARSYNFYPIGRARPDQGVVDLALGLGKTIVDGGLVWCYSPSFPKVTPPVGSVGELMKTTQTEFWAVNMGKPPEHDPIKETEYMVKRTLAEAEYDGVLKYIASTYRPQDDRLVSGIGHDGPRVLTFAPVLSGYAMPFNQLVTSLLKMCEESVGSEVEIEFAVTLDRNHGLPARFGFLQVRPMVVSHSKVEVASVEMSVEKVLAASENVMGNGVVENIVDIVYIRPETFKAQYTREIASELEAINRKMADTGRKYLLIGFGRWGSSDPWLGIPVEWSQISGAGAIVEATMPDMNVDLSQGSHFFHNISSFQICYFMVPHTGKFRIDWDWLGKQKEESRKEFVSHVKTAAPLTIKVDGRTGRGAIFK
nr:hypothetical protein [candidate division Zixibacteria bacterium]